MGGVPRMAIGVDIIEIDNIAEAILRWQTSFLKRIYTETEIESCSGSGASLAAGCAGKEAVMKAIGDCSSAIGFKDIEIISNDHGRPIVYLSRKAFEISRRIGISTFHISLSHCEKYAVAFVVGEVSPVDRDNTK
jgi:phosphopantetheine--protein transferase-like protein